MMHRATAAIWVLGGTATVSATALYSAHAPIPLLSTYDHPFTRVSLSLLGRIADTLQDVRVPSVVLALYSGGAATRDSDGEYEYASIRAYRMRPIDTNNINITQEEDSALMLAPISGEVLSTGAVRTGGAMVSTTTININTPPMYIREVLGADDKDPLSARGVRVTTEDIAGYTDYSLRYVHIRPRMGDSLYTIAPTDVSGVQVRSMGGVYGEFGAFGTQTGVERAVYTGTWDGGLLSMVCFSGPGRRHNIQDINDMDIGRRQPLEPAPQPASLLVVFECADDGLVTLVKAGDGITAGQPLAKVSSMATLSNSNKEGSSGTKELDEYKERRQKRGGKEGGRVRRSW